MPQLRQLRMSAWILWGLPAALAVLLQLISPTYFAGMPHSGLGTILLFGALIGWLVAGMVVRWIVGSAESGRITPERAPVTMLVPMVGLIFPVLFVIVLGPALVVVVAR